MNDPIRWVEVSRRHWVSAEELGLTVEEWEALRDSGTCPTAFLPSPPDHWFLICEDYREGYIPEPTPLGRAYDRLRAYHDSLQGSTTT